MNTKHDISRRSFMKSTLGSLSVLFAGATALVSKLVSAAGAATPKLLDEQNSIAKAMKFVQDATKSKDRKDPKAVCTNCVLYKKQTEIDGAEAGICTMLTGGLVKGGGWCASWVKNKKVY